jgi:trk system potassium uptake protein TrkH
MHPNAVWPVRVGRNPVPQNILHRGAGLRLRLHVSAWSALTLVLSAVRAGHGDGLLGRRGDLNNTGPGLGLVGPASNYQGLDRLHKWVLCFAMILGRLEIFTFLVVLTPTFWRR